MPLVDFSPDRLLPPPPAAVARPPSLGFSLGYGALALGLVSVAAYSLWAFRLIRSEGPLYAAIAVVYLLLGGLALSRLVVVRGHALRFAGLFAVGFLAYAVLWCAAWFGLRGRHLADLWGALAGLAALASIFRSAFGPAEPTRGIVTGFLVLFALHSAGYYLGDVLHGSIRGANGRLLWGAAHGLGFGAGLGCLLHQLQAPHRARLNAAAPSPSS
jgi:hypothetical protein